MPSRDSKVHFFFSGSQPAIRQRTTLKKFLSSIFIKEGFKLDALRLIFTTDRTLYEINKKYLKHDFFTDIITFSLSEKNQPINAEIYISTDRVRENSLIHNTSFKAELHRVIFHGVLHLCGYNDKTKKETIQMRLREDFYLSEYFK